MKLLTGGSGLIKSLVYFILPISHCLNKELPVTIKASLWFMICSFIQKRISFFTVPIYTKMLITSEYGFYSVYLSWESIVYIFATLNLNIGVFNNGMIKYEDKRDVFTSATQGLSTILCLIVAIILLFFDDVVEKYSKLTPHIIVLMMALVFFSASYNYWITKKKFDFQYHRIVVATLVATLGTPFLVIMLMRIMKIRSDGIILGTVIAQSSVGLVLYILNYIKGKKGFDREIWKYYLFFNLSLIPHYLSYDGKTIELINVITTTLAITFMMLYPYLLVRFF